MKTFYTRVHTVKVNFFIICLAAFAGQKAFGQNPGQALQLNGAGQYATTTVGGNTVGAEYTVEAWVSPMDATKTMTIFSTRGTGGNNNTEIAFDMKLQGGNTIHADIPDYNGSSYLWANTTADISYNYTVGHWYHIAYLVSTSGQFIKIYVNGVLQKTIAQSFSNTRLFDANHVTGYIGSNRGYNTTEDFVGNIDEVKIYNASDISPAADAISTSASNNGRNAIAYYHFDNSTASAGTSATSAVLAGSPAYVTSLAMQTVTTSVAAKTSSGFTASWSSGNSANVTNYLVDVSDKADFSRFFTTSFTSSTAGSITGLAPNTQYYYRVTPNNAVTGVGIYSSAIPVTTNNWAPAAISYTTPNTFIKNTAISPFSPTNTGGSITIEVPYNINNTIGTVLDIALDASNNIFFTTGSNSLYEHTAGSNSYGVVVSGFSNPSGLAVNAAGNIIIADQGNHIVKKVVLGQGVSQVGGTINTPKGIALDRTGNIYVTDIDKERVYKIDTSGLTTIFWNPGIATGEPTAITVDLWGNVYVSENTGFIEKITPDGTAIKFITFGTGITRLATDGAANLYAVSTDHSIRKITPDGNSVTIASSLDYPYAIAVDVSGNIYYSITSTNGLAGKITSQGGPVASYSANPALPAGLTLNSATGEISGTPSSFTGSAASYVVTASNNGGNTSAAISITVNDIAPASLSYGTSSFVFGNGRDVGSLAPSFTGGAPTSYSISPALPAGLSFSASTGIISGTPSAASPQASYKVTANNVTGSTTVTFTITVLNPPASVSYGASSFTYSANIAIASLTPSVTGGAPSGYSISPALPSGLSFNTSSGVISGTPTVASVQTFYQVTVSNTAGSATATFTIVVIAAPASLSYGAASYTYIINTPVSSLSPSSSGGTPVSYNVSPSLPAGLSLNLSTGVISGIPTAISPSASYIITATNTAGNTACTISIQVAYPAGTTVYADAANGSDANDGSGSFSNAFKTLSYALQIAASNAGISKILIAAGAYYPAGTAAATAANSDTAFVITRNGIRLYGGYNATTGVRNTAVNKTYLDGNNSSYHILVISGVGQGDSVVADGLTIRAAKARGGGALHTYKGNGFNSNEGGAVAAKNNSGLGGKLLFSNCIFTNNTSENDGGAFYDAETSPNFVNCLFANNSAAVNGGAMFNYDGSNPVFTNCTVAYNVSAKGAAIDNFGSSTPVLNNSIVWLNGTSSGSNNSGITNNATTVATGTYSIIQGGVGTNSTADPLFVNASTGNYQLLTLSPGINTGSNALYTGSINNDADLNGNARLKDITIDMGAYEAAAAAATVYVDSANGSDANDGSTWARAFKTLSGAVSLAGTSHVTNTVLIAAGTYYPAGTAAATAANSDTSFTMLRNGIRLYGGYNAATGARNAAVNKTYLDGNNSSYHILAVAGIGAGDSVIADGVTIRNASARSGGLLHTYNGTGFNSNEGGAVAAKNNSGLGNKLLFRNCAFLNNASDDDGAAFYDAETSPNFVNCLFANNTAAINGGAMFNYDGSNPVFTNCTIAYNVSAKGAAIDNFGGSTPLINNSIVWLNGTSAGTNNSGITNDASPAATGSSSIIQGGIGSNNMADPLFVNAAGGNYSITTNSPALNTGNNALYAGNINSDSDLDGKTRLVATAIDMGAYESYQPYGLAYTGSPFTFVKGTTITTLTPLVNGGTATYSISLALPAGLSFNTSTGAISGTPAALSSAATYTITAANTGGSTNTTVQITVKDVTPSGLSYTGSPFLFTKGSAITALTPSSGGGAVTSYSISPALPGGLLFNTGTGVISGTPITLSTQASYTITASNTGGNTNTAVQITVNDVAPSALAYNGSSFIFTKGTSVTPLSPSVSGGIVTGYSISPALPAGLTIDATTGVINGIPAVTSPLTYYTVTAINSGGSTTAPVDITVRGPDTTNAILCLPGVYHWNGNDYSAAGIYTTHITLAGGRDSVAVLSLTAKASPTAAAIRANQQITTACYGLTRKLIATPTGGTAPYLYSLDGTTWQDSARFEEPAGTYHIIVKDNNGCTVTTGDITLTQPAEKLVITGTQVTGADITVTATGGYGGYTYSLDGGAYSTSNTLTGVSAGIDTVRVHDQGGCIAAARVNILTATVTYDGGNNMVCYNRNKVITITPAGGVRPYRYTFDGNTAGRIMLAAPGTHTITVQDAAGNSYSTGITITAPAEKLNLTLAHSNATCAGGDGSITALPSGGYAGYTYSLNSGSYAGENVFNNLDAGTYSVAVQDAAGCTSPVRTAIVKVPVNPCPGLRSGGEPTSSKGEMAGALVVKVMPNPAVVEFTLQVVSGDSKKVVEIRVMDMLGRTVYHTRGSVFDSYRFGRSFAGGMYIAEVLNGTSVQRVKLVKGN